MQINWITSCRLTLVIAPLYPEFELGSSIKVSLSKAPGADSYIAYPILLWSIIQESNPKMPFKLSNLERQYISGEV
jgi:hypothetical protein